MAHVVPKVLLSPSTAISGPPKFESVLELWVAGLRRAGFIKSESKQAIVLFIIQAESKQAIVLFGAVLVQAESKQAIALFSYSC